MTGIPSLEFLSFFLSFLSNSFISLEIINYKKEKDVCIYLHILGYGF